MSTILYARKSEPPFPATDQNPSAVRYQIGAWWVDAIGGQPTQAEMDAFIVGPALGDLDRFSKDFKALALCVASVGNMTPAQMKALFKAKWESLP